MGGDDTSLSDSERSASATSDFYNLDHTEKNQVSPLPIHVGKQPSAQPPRTPTRQHLTAVDPICPISGGTQKDDDAASACSSSAMDISSPSRSPTPEPEPARAAYAMLQTSLTKRKANDFVDVADMSDDAVGDHAKKRKLLPRSPSGLGMDQANIILPEQWQHVFTFLSPFDLVSVLRTCRKFNHLLCGIKVPSVSKKSQDKPRMVDSDTVWARARKLHFPSLPRALNQYGELQMLQLIGNKSCHICESLSASTATHAGTAFNAGPGASGVRVIWQFGVRLCGKCFLKTTLTVGHSGIL
nr:hypothetical protein CFP56_22443 [Quercus suber]